MVGRVEGKIAVITGSASGIGRATALLLAREGATVIVADIDESGVERTAELVTAAGGKSYAVRCDVGSESDVVNLMDSAVERFGRLDVLHNNAYWAPKDVPVVETTIEDWQRTLTVSLTSVFLGCRAALPHMIAGGGGAIVNTASTAGLSALPRFAAYTAAKGGVVALTRSVALDYGRHGVRCNAVCPGIIETPATAAMLADPDRRAAYIDRQMLERIGQPDDVAQIVLHLASDESRYLTGQAIVVDGGRRA